MKYKCTCDEARTEEIRQRLLRSALPYCFYLKLLNRPIFAFDSEDDMMRAVMATDGQLMMLSSHVPPRAKEKLSLTPGASQSTLAPARMRQEAISRPAGLFPGVRSGASLRPADLPRRAPAKLA
jgi:hypothetical protein